MTKIKLADGREIESSTVNAYENVVRAVAFLELMSVEDLVWLRSRVSDLLPHNGPSAEADVFIAFQRAINWHIEEEAPCPSPK